jgi:hypothetical protein
MIRVEDGIRQVVLPDYLRARYYDPSTGQFLSRDPAVATTRHPYTYVYDNPLNLTDPTGLCPWNDPGCFVGLIGQLPGAVVHDVGEVISNPQQGVQNFTTNVQNPWAVGAAVTVGTAVGVACFRWM